MTHFQFAHLPTEDEIVAHSTQITSQTATQILQVVTHWVNKDETRQIQLLNYLCNQVELKGRDHWEDLRWSVLVSRIRQLSTQINSSVEEITELRISRPAAEV